MKCLLVADYISVRLMGKIHKLINRERRTPKPVRIECSKSPKEIMKELSGIVNINLPKLKKSVYKTFNKKSKKKRKKQKINRDRSSSSSRSDMSDYSKKQRNKKKSELKKRRDNDRHFSSCVRTPSPPPPCARTSTEPTTPDLALKTDDDGDITLNQVQDDLNDSQTNTVSIKYEEDFTPPRDDFDPSLIPMPETQKEINLDSTDLRFMLEKRNLDNAEQSEHDRSKGKIQIKNLKFSSVYEETVKKAEEEARARSANDYEDEDYSDSSSSPAKEDDSNPEFPKSSDPGGILKKQMAEESKLSKDGKGHSKRSKNRGSDTSRSRKRSVSRSRRSRSRSKLRRYHRSSPRTSRTNRSRRSTSRSRRISTSRSRRISTSRSRRISTSKSRRISSSRSRLRSVSRSDVRARPYSPRHRDRRSRSPTGVKLADSEKKRLLEVARRNAISMLKNGAVPAGAAALPAHTRNQVMAAIQSGGKSVAELTNFCKYLSQTEALGELAPVPSNDEDQSENEDTLAFHHPYLLKEKTPIFMNLWGGAPVPSTSNVVSVVNKDELRLQFPVSSGSHHREHASEWEPPLPGTSDMQVATLDSTADLASIALPPEADSSEFAEYALPPLPPLPSLPPPVEIFVADSLLPPLPADDPQGCLPENIPPEIDIKSIMLPSNDNAPENHEQITKYIGIQVSVIVSQKITELRQEHDENEQRSIRERAFAWSNESNLGQFTGTTGAQILTPRELASGTQAWAKRGQLEDAAPVESGMGMHLLQKMGWTPGQGLGKEGTGPLKPLLLEVKLDTKGLHSKDEDPKKNGKGARHQRYSRRGQVSLLAGGKHPVSLLGEHCSRYKLGIPEYRQCFECGPDHKKNFLFKVKIAGVEYRPAMASANKKQAKADAALLALQQLGVDTQ